MTDVIDAPARPARANYVGGAWVPAASGETYTKTNPMRWRTVGEFVVERSRRGPASPPPTRRSPVGLPLAPAFLTAAAAVLEARTSRSRGI